MVGHVVLADVVAVALVPPGVGAEIDPAKVRAWTGLLELGQQLMSVDSRSHDEIEVGALGGWPALQAEDRVVDERDGLAQASFFLGMLRWRNAVGGLRLLGRLGCGTGTAGHGNKYTVVRSLAQNGTMAITSCHAPPP